MRHEGAATFEKLSAEAQPRISFERPVPGEWLVGILFSYLASSQLLLWRFLDVMPSVLYVAGGLLVGALCWGVVSSLRRHSGVNNPTVGTFLVCFGIAVALFVLGGEGRIFYSNTDWQVRDAVLRDMSVHPWPFVYTARGYADVLRAPLGMYFVPALAFKALGSKAADTALLLQNSLLLAIVLALASTLFSNTRQRVISVVVFLVFSGLDAVGELVTHRFFEHLDSWAGIQFSSTITLAFWVPQHALAGWIGAALYLLWEKGDRPLSLLLTLVPLTALWSPLSLIGTMPFAAVAGATALARRELRVSDVLQPLGSALLCLPGLLYLAAADHSVGAGLLHISFADYLLFESLEALPFLVPLAYVAIRFRENRATVAVAALCLLVAPLFRIGSSVDFTMRASIPALAIVAMLTSKLLTDSPERKVGLMKAWLIIVLCVGSATGLSEVRRAVTHPASPLGTCSFFKASDESSKGYPKDSYLAPLNQMPELIRPRAPATLSAAEPARCWPGDWYRPGLL